jgi:hypothetical protein
MAAISHEQPGKTRVLLRRLLVTCPVTSLLVDTGLELTAHASIGPGPQLLVDCTECGQDHWWRRDETFPG